MLSIPPMNIRSTLNPVLIHRASLSHIHKTCATSSRPLESTGSEIASLSRYGTRHRLRHSTLYGYLSPSSPFVALFFFTVHDDDDASMLVILCRSRLAASTISSRHVTLPATKTCCYEPTVLAHPSMTTMRRLHKNTVSAQPVPYEPTQRLKQTLRLQAASNARLTL